MFVIVVFPIMLKKRKTEKAFYKMEVYVFVTIFSKQKIDNFS